MAPSLAYRRRKESEAVGRQGEQWREVRGRVGCIDLGEKRKQGMTEPDLRDAYGVDLWHAAAAPRWRGRGGGEAEDDDDYN